MDPEALRITAAIILIPCLVALLIGMNARPRR